MFFCTWLFILNPEHIHFRTNKTIKPGWSEVTYHSGYGKRYHRLRTFRICRKSYRNRRCRHIRFAEKKKIHELDWKFNKEIVMAGDNLWTHVLLNACEMCFTIFVDITYTSFIIDDKTWWWSLVSNTYTMGHYKLT